MGYQDCDAALSSGRFIAFKQGMLGFRIERRGRFVQHGTHEELMSSASQYAQFYNIQAAAYR